MKRFELDLKHNFHAMILIALFLTASTGILALADEAARFRPPPRGEGPSGERPPREMRKRPSDAVIQLFDEERDAVTETESEAARDKLRALYGTTTNENDKEAIRHFFARHPSSVSKQNGSTFREVPSSNVTQ